MLLVVADPRDATAASLVDRWERHAARLLRPADLTCGGWRHEPGAPERGQAVVGGDAVPCREIRGVLTRLPAVDPATLGHADEALGAFVAAEMTAFLLAWLTSLRCPVVNRPRPTCLAGPGWSRERWLLRARALGQPVSSDAPGDAPPSVTVACGSCSDGGRPALGRRAQALAAAAGADILAVTFAGADDDAPVNGAWPVPYEVDDALADAVLARLLARARAAA